MKIEQNFSPAQHRTAQHSTAQHSTAQHSTAQHSTAIIWYRKVQYLIAIFFMSGSIHLSAQNLPNASSFVNFQGKQYAQINNIWHQYLVTEEKFEWVDNQVITVKFKPDISPEKRSGMSQQYGLTYVNNTKAGWYDYQVNGASLLPKAISLKADSRVAQVVINQKINWYATTPNDANLTINPITTTSVIVADYKKYLERIKHFDAIDIMQNGAEGWCNHSAVIAILDNEFNYQLPELYTPAVGTVAEQTNIYYNAGDPWPTKNDPSSVLSPYDDDLNGKDDDHIGWDFAGDVPCNMGAEDRDVRNVSTAINYDGHGTPIAHIIGARQNNGVGMAGIAGGWGTIDGAKMMFIKVAETGSGDNCDWSTAKVKYGLEYARVNGAKIVSMSFGWKDFDQSVEDELQLCYDVQGMFIVAGCGNACKYCGPKTSYRMRYPARSKYVFSVGASGGDWSGATYFDMAWERNQYVDAEYGLQLLAPGGENWIGTYDRLGNPLAFGGTSASAPMVASVAANMLCINPCLTNIQVGTILRNSANQVHASPPASTGILSADYGVFTPADPHPHAATKLQSERYGYGMLDEQAALIGAGAETYVPFDLYIKDCADDLGIEYTTADPAAYACGTVTDKSPDIWIRRNDDGLYKQENEGALHNSDNWIYVRVRNRSCTPYIATTDDGVLNLYWSVAASYGSWPANWDGTTPSIGGLLGSVTLPNIPAGSSVVLKLSMPASSWPSVLTANKHFCVMARLEKINNDVDPPFTLVYNLEAPFNNCALLNTMMFGVTPPKKMPPTVSNVFNTLLDNAAGYEIKIGNPRPHNSNFNYTFEELSGRDYSLLQDADINIVFDQQAWAAFANCTAMNSTDVKIISPRVIKILSSKVVFGNVPLPANARCGIFVSINMHTEADIYRKYEYRITQRCTESNIDDGAMNFEIVSGERPRFDANAGPDRQAFNSEPISISATDIGEPARYVWTNTQGQVIHEGKEFTTSFAKSEELTVTISANSDGYRSVDEMKVQHAGAVITTITPNPISNSQSFSIQINTTMQGPKTLLITNGQNYFTFNVPPESANHTVTCSIAAPGVYTAVLICNGTITDTETLLVQ
jgi:Subtilase family